MRYQALLFSADEKASRVLNQILGELDFHVEACTEPFAAVKQITNEHYDALVVDCEDEQNAALLFKSARNSNFNSDSLAVALVQGQGAIAKAFRIGANLILTKPINAEQSKGTLRTAKGLLRQAQAAKAVAAAAAASSPPVSAPAEEPTKSTEPSADILPILEPPASTLPFHPEFSVGAVTGALEQQPEEFPALGPAEAALIESMPETLLAPASPTAGPQQAIGDEPGAMITTTALAIRSTPGSAASAAAPAKEAAPPAVSPDEKLSEELNSDPVPEKTVAASASAKAKPVVKPAPRMEPPKFAQLSGKNSAAGQTGNGRNLLIAAVLVLGFAGAIYYAWPQLEPFLSRIPIVQKYLGLPQPQSEAPIAAPAAASQAQTPASGSGTMAASGQPQTPPSDVSTESEGANQSNVAPATSANKVADSSGGNSPLLLQVAPDAAAALLMEKVDPTYPPSARQQGIQESVQLQANIGKDGTTSNIKVLSGKPILATAAVAAVKQWKYEPYKVDGQPTEVQTQITLNFKLP